MPINYPNVKREDFIEQYFGTEVSDPYRYMEDPDHPETKRFVEQNNQLVEDFLNQEYFNHYKSLLEHLSDFTRLTVPVKRANKYYYAKSVEDKTQLILYSLDQSGNEKQVFDINKLSEDGTTGSMLQFYSYDGKHLAMFVTEQGSDWQYIQVVEVDTGKQKEKLNWVTMSNVAWLSDNSGFYYTKFPEQTGLSVEEQRRSAKLYLHKLNTLQDEDIMVFDPGNEEYNPDIYSYNEGSQFLIMVTETTLPENLLYYFAKGEPTDPKIESIVSEFDGSFYYPFEVVDNKIYIRSSLDAPNNKIFAVKIGQWEKSQWQTIISEQEYPLKLAAVAKDKLVCIYERDVKQEIDVHNLDGSFNHTIQMPTIGTLSAGRSYNPSIWSSVESTEFIFGFTSFFSPTSVFTYDVDSKELTELLSNGISIPVDRYYMRQVFYPSKDGTNIPMYIIHKKGIKQDGKNPTLLYGYGGYNISILPQFSPFFMSWIDDGYVMAIANLRGGGEYGKKWHDQALLGNKQTVFDDFIAAAEWLIDNDYTSAKHIGINGRSNGGLLVGATLVQRPDLFGAAIPIVGVLDMLRYPFQKDAGRYWTKEYGNAKESRDHFDFLINYSPYHNVKPNTKYPPTLITAAEGDDRVAPMHSKKFGAELQYAQIGDAPILVRIETKTGHGYGKPKDKEIEDHAIHLTFFKQILDS